MVPTFRSFDFVDVVRSWFVVLDRTRSILCRKSL
jgi:hypothetical protein